VRRSVEDGTKTVGSPTARSCATPCFIEKELADMLWSMHRYMHDKCEPIEIF